MGRHHPASALHRPGAHLGVVDGAHFPPSAVSQGFCHRKYHRLATSIMKWQLHTIWNRLRGLQMNLAAQPASRNHHHCNMVAIQSKCQPAHQTSGLPRPPASACWGDAPSALHGPGSHVLTDLGAHVPTRPLAGQNSAPTSTLAARGLARKATRGNWRGITAPCRHHTPSSVRDGYEYPRCAQGTCLSLNINMNKPLSSFILLSLQSEPPASHPRLAARCSRCAFCEAGPAMSSFLPAESLRPGDAQRWLHRTRCTRWSGRGSCYLAPTALRGPGQSCVPRGEGAFLGGSARRVSARGLGPHSPPTGGHEDLARPSLPMNSDPLHFKLGPSVRGQEHGTGGSALAHSKGHCTGAEESKDEHFQRKGLRGSEQERARL